MQMAKPLFMTVLCAFLTGCSLPALDQRSESHALTPEESLATPLGQAIAPLAAAHPGKSGIHPLPDAHDAFAARMMLARAAERSLDVQYYIWHADMTGTMLLEALHDAADRGVRVRLLLDDNGTAGLDQTLSALDGHPNIEVRLYNPFVLRWPKPLGYVTDFSRLNRRMHNKSFTADNQATIIGGRNVGDEYFGATNGVLFTDLDVLAIGAAVNDVSSDFDRYWASDSAYPVDRLLKKAASNELDELEADATKVERSPEAAAYAEAMRKLPFIRQLLKGELSLEWAQTRMVSDDPRKTLGTAPREAMLPHQLHEILGEPATDLALVSPYFVPTATGTQAFAKMARNGVKVRVLTNALEATDVAVVHSGYAKHRKDLLAAGVELFEMKRQAQDLERNKSMGPFGSSGSSLHAKTFAVDGQRIFVGSFNFDPRSARLNTELGFVIDSPTLAKRISDAFEQEIPGTAYRVQLDETGKLYWLEQRDGKTIRHDTEPGASVWQRLSVWMASLLPLEPLL
ncbi:phospholipase D family protein [Achromobacter deleyi]|uniref:phospholipase D family protein n=1 Tax=Achromobacter deleyi TaxID=1353891 RepID=UPI0014918B1C|nr:phospholipase D family protein [Achromobacter deleyi]QVQ26518.1 phospholipase D family protein [Achromobacter deleyi]UIP22090.1 phospholipase D family protein [Achromobacter deleyi]